MKLRFYLVFFLLLYFSPVNPCTAQDSAKRPTVGLVLSGGGARGLAHIGVLEWFEENRIPVDYIAGTSMGGLVGGMYALGMSPQEMRDYIETIDWQRAFGTGSQYEQLSFRRKEDQRAYQTDLEFGWKKGLRLPSGISSGHYIGMRVDRIVLPYSEIRDFDALPIPFRCVAVDLVKAEPITLKDGSLSLALRATISLPGIFSPVRIDDRVLVDGGVLNNIPTDVMQKMGADVIIAVNIGTPLLDDPDAVATFGGVLSQTVGVMMEGNTKANFDRADIRVEPDLGKTTTLDFSKIDEVIVKGRKGAEDKSAELLKLALSKEDYDQYREVIKSRIRTTVPAPQRIIVSGVPESAAESIRLNLEQFITVQHFLPDSPPWMTKTPDGGTIGRPVIEDRLTRIVGQGRYESLNYGLSEEEEAVKIRVREKSYGPPTINFAFQMQGSDISNFNVSFGTRVTLFDVWKQNSEWRNDFNIGFDSLISTEYYYPLGHRGFFFAPRAFYERTRESLFDPDLGRVAEFNVNRYGFGGDFGFGTWQHEFRLGYFLARDSAELRAGSAEDGDIAGKADGVRFRWAMDRANSATLPTRGSRMNAEMRYYFSAPETVENFLQLEVNPVMAHPVSDRGTIFAAGLFGTTFDKDAGPFQQFLLGGPFRLGAYDEGEFRGNHAAFLSAGYYHQIYQLPPLIGGKLWLAAWYSGGDAFDDFGEIDMHHQGSLAFIMDTKLGPFALVGALGEDGSTSVYFTFGRLF